MDFGTTGYFYGDMQLLTDTQVRTAKKKDKAYKLSDAEGLHLYVSTAGGKLWRMRYEFDGKEKLLSFGKYPDLSLADARRERDAAKAHLRAGRDPGLERKKEKAADAAAAAGTTFEVAAREWHSQQIPTWSPKHADDVIESLEKEVFPALGALPINDITPPMVLNVLKPIQARGAIETGHRVRQRISAVFVYGIGSSYCVNDPAAIVQKALAPVVKGKQPAVLTLKEAREILRRVDDTPAHPVTRLAMRFLAITVVRPGTLAATPWAEVKSLIGQPDPIWFIPAARMKLRVRQKLDEARDHLVPLPSQAIETLEALLTLTGRGPLCFPNNRKAHKPMSENALGYLLNRAGYHYRHVPHGWRTTFSTVMNELHRQDAAVIDFMLAHVRKDKVEAAYNRAEYLQRRKELAQEWADMLLEGMPLAADLLTLPGK